MCSHTLGEHTNRAAQMHGKALQQHLTYFSSLTSSLDLKQQQTETEQANKQKNPNPKQQQHITKPPFPLITSENLMLPFFSFKQGEC